MGCGRGAGPAAHWLAGPGRCAKTARPSARSSELPAAVASAGPSWAGAGAGGGGGRGAQAEARPRPRARSGQGLAPDPAAAAPSAPRGARRGHAGDTSLAARCGESKFAAAEPLPAPPAPDPLAAPEPARGRPPLTPRGMCSGAGRRSASSAASSASPAASAASSSSPRREDEPRTVLKDRNLLLGICQGRAAPRLSE
ncbi:hypothetical protein J0S82_018770 [Galemys pyrenaicus]|uniref:Uncharacterized protein n=1 Tax=Galemys pyrenaicus TaxID=202257 RepID=A0A8J6DLC4_GALPY|nr:hypothetical protein J0S82_018770 [Galemys pyrenaicus]